MIYTVLESNNVQQTDTGVYTCEAANEEGKVYAVLNVEGEL